MLKSRHKKLTILTVLFISIFLLGLFHNSKIAYAQTHEETINLPQNFQIDEFYENEGIMENVTSIDIDLGSSRWNITDVELNFTNIKFIRETRGIETDNSSDHDKKLYKKDLGFAVEVKITEQTRIYGVQIHGQMVSLNQTTPMLVQIQGYDSVTEKPNGTIFGSTFLNISGGDKKWYIQKFSTPFILSKGQYYLVINGTKMTQGDGANFYFSINDINPIHPDLMIWEYISESWSVNNTGEPFLYKLDQKIIDIFNPEQSNMTVDINGKPEPVDGVESESGYLNLKNIEFFPNEEVLHLPIKNNRSDTLLFNLSYCINLEYNFLTSGSVTINTNKEIEWNIKFNLTRSDGNYTVKFSYPNSWSNLGIKKNGELLNEGDDYINNPSEKALYILNGTVPDESVPWEIIAESTNKDIIIDADETKFTAGTELIFGVDSPLKGNYTYVLYALGFEKYRNITEYDGIGSLTFLYLIPATAPNGEWTAVIYWNNQTDAGVETQSFTISGGIIIIPGGNGGGGGGGITRVTGLDPLLVFTISLITIIGAVAVLASYQTVKRVKRKRELELQKLHNKFVDILSLNYLLVVDKKTGLNVYEQFFAGKMIDASLISGFFEAIRNFGIELTGTYTQSQTVKLEFQESKILMSEFRDFRIILVMTENPSEDFLTSITKLSYDIEENFGELLREFKGDTTKFRDINKLVEKNFYVSFIAPLTVRDVSDMKLKDAEIAMINKAKSIMKQNKLNYFFTSFLLPEQTYDPKKTRIIFNLIDKKIFMPTKLT